MTTSRPTSVDTYIEAAPDRARAHLRRIRSLLLELAPDATEAIKWGHPVLEEKRILFAYSAHKTHMNFMPTGPSLVPFKDELTEFKTGKDTIQFPYDKPLPDALIRKIAAHRLHQVRENHARWMY